MIFKEDLDALVENSCLNCEEADIEFEFIPIVSKETGEMKAVAAVFYCDECDDVEIYDIFTDGSEEMEILAAELGLRDGECCEDCEHELEDDED